MNKINQRLLNVGNESQYLDIAEVVLITLDRNGNITLLNKKGHKILEYEEGELIGKNWFETCLPEYNRVEVRSIFNKIMQGMIENSEFYENTVITKNGSEKLIVWHNTLLRDDEGKIIGTLSSGEDVTIRKKIEQKLIESEEKFRTIAEETEIGIIIFQDNEFKYSNKAIELISGYSPDNIKKWSNEVYIDKINPKDANSFLTLINNFSEGDVASIDKYPFRIKDAMGDVKWIELTAKTITYLGKDATMYTIIDISDKKQTEQNLRELSNLKSELIKRASHELNTPLISIKGFTDLLLNLHVDKFDEDVISILKEINEGANRLALIINNLLKTSRLESNNRIVKKTKQKLSFLIKFCANELQGLARARDLQIFVDTDENIYVEVVKEEIYIVISHLIINAIKYTPPNGLIRVKSDIKDGFCVISVEDNGIGITIEESKQLFRKFGKIERYGKEWEVAIDGLGLGLYNSKKIIEMHGGKMWAESQGRNKGSKFFFTLPLLKTEESLLLKEN